MATPRTRGGVVAHQLIPLASPHGKVELYRNAETPAPKNFAPYLKEGASSVRPQLLVKLCNGIYVDYPPIINVLPVEALRVDKARPCGSCKLQFQTQRDKDQHKNKYPAFCPQHRECVADLWKHVQSRSHTRCPVCNSKKYDDNGKLLQHYVRYHL